MPTSPNNRAGGGDSSTPGETPGAVSNSQEGKKAPQTNSGTPPNHGSSAEQPRQTSSSRKLQRQNLMRRFMKSREDAQLAGLIETTPKEAIGKRDERVKHDDPKLIETAIRSGWSVPEEKKPGLVQELVDIVTDKSEECSDKTKVAAFRALLTADQAQHERDNPEVKKGGAVVNVSVQTNIAAVDVLRTALREQSSVQQPTPIEDK